MTNLNIPLWIWLIIAALLAVSIIIAKIAFEVRSTKDIIVARTKHVQNASDGDRNLVHYGKRAGGHYVKWPRVWCNQAEAAERGAMIVNELWPDETAEPVSGHRSVWVQRSKKL